MMTLGFDEGHGAAKGKGGFTQSLPGKGDPTGSGNVAPLSEIEVPEWGTRTKLQGKVLHVGSNKVAGRSGEGEMPQDTLKVEDQLGSLRVIDAETLVSGGTVNEDAG
jgi:hypothetical protein